MPETRTPESTMDALGMGFANWSNTPMIQNLQMKEGHEPCFRSQKSTRCTEDCQWGRDCRRLVAEWLREW